MKYLSLFFIIFTITTAHAEINKCTDSKGKVTFTDEPCKHGQSATTHKINPINIADSSTDRKAISEFNRQQNNT